MGSALLRIQFPHRGESHHRNHAVEPSLRAP